MVFSKLASVAVATLGFAVYTSGTTVTTPSEYTVFPKSELVSGKSRYFLNEVDTFKVVEGVEDGAEYHFVDMANLRMWVVNSVNTTVNRYDIDGVTGKISGPTASLSAAGAPNSVAYSKRDNILAVAEGDGESNSNNGVVEILDPDTLEVIQSIQTGPLPDHVSFGPQEGCLYTANEGERESQVDDAYGGLTLACSSDFSDVNVAPTVTTRTLQTLSDEVMDEITATGGAHNPLSDGTEASNRDPFRKSLEPEFIAYSDAASDGRYEIYVICQEANLFLVYESNTNTDAPISTDPIRIMPLGLKDWSLEGNTVDIADDDVIDMQNYPLKGIYQPDTIKYVKQGGKGYLITANEGDALSDDSEDDKIKDFEADYSTDLAAVVLAQNDDFKDLKVSRAGGLDTNGKFTEFHHFGGRSFSVFDAETGALVYESSNQFELLMKDYAPEFFNINDGEVQNEKRSNNKGPEPESLAVGTVDGKTLLFVGFERPGLIGVWDISNILQPVFHSLVGLPAVVEEGTDTCLDGSVARMIDPEALSFVDAASSPTGKPLLIATGAVSSTIHVFELELDNDPVNQVCAPRETRAPSSGVRFFFSPALMVVIAFFFR